MNDKVFFRITVLLSIISYIFWFFYPSLGLFLPDAETTKLVSLSGYGAKITIEPFMYWAVFTLFIAASIGLLFFFNWARGLFTVLLLISFVLTGVSGVSVDSGMGAFFRDLTTLLDGIILLYIFSSQLHPYFSKTDTAR